MSDDGGVSKRDFKFVRSQRAVTIALLWNSADSGGKRRGFFMARPYYSSILYFYLFYGQNNKKRTLLILRATNYRDNYIQVKLNQVIRHCPNEFSISCHFQSNL